MSVRIVVHNGDVYGRLSIVRELEPHISPSGEKRRKMLCKCFCGNEVPVFFSNLRKGNTESCGCLQKERASKAKTTHGMCGHPAFGKWDAMKRRTSDTSDRHEHYAGRGIKICKEWRDDPVEFCKWAEKAGFKKGLELDRIDNDKGYSPDNCQFVDRKENMANTRNSYLLNINGRNFEAYRQAARALGLSPNTVRHRCNSKNFPEWRSAPKYQKFH